MWLNILWRFRVALSCGVFRVAFSCGVFVWYFRVVFSRGVFFVVTARSFPCALLPRFAGILASDAKKIVTACSLQKAEMRSKMHQRQLRAFAKVRLRRKKKQGIFI